MRAYGAKSSEREKLRDPIALFRERALEARWLSESDVREIDKSVSDLIDEAVAFADASPEPPASELLTDIFKDADGGERSDS